MALVRRLEHVPLQVNVRHSEVDATYSLIQDDDGRRYLQIDTYGAADRQIPGKKSQSIRLAPEAITALKKILAESFS